MIPTSNSSPKAESRSSIWMAIREVHRLNETGIANVDVADHVQEIASEDAGHDQDLDLDHGLSMYKHQFCSTFSL